MDKQRQDQGKLILSQTGFVWLILSPNGSLIQLELQCNQHLTANLSRVLTLNPSDSLTYMLWCMYLVVGVNRVAVSQRPSFSMQHSTAGERERVRNPKVRKPTRQSASFGQLPSGQMRIRAPRRIKLVMCG